MHRQFKKIFSVALALVLGLGIIFFAWGRGASLGNKVSFEPTISSESWKDSLLAVPQSSLSKIKSVSQKEQGATTTTDIVGRELLVNYALLQQNRATTTLNDVEATILAQGLVEKIKVPEGLVYATENIIISVDNSDSALAVYAKKVGDTIKIFSAGHKVNELNLVADALASQDEAKLQGLATAITDYQKLQKSLLLISVPSTIAPLHLRLVQGYSNIEASIRGMQKILSDPLLGLAAITKYKKETDSLNALATEYRNYIPAH